MTASRRRIHALVHGRVQGVGFRAFVQREALALGLSGTVRNNYSPRAHVEVVAEGPEDALHRLLDVLQMGPRLSNVERVDVDWELPQDKFTSFHIDH